MPTHPQQMRCPMTREHAPRAQAHSAVALFIATLTILIALVALAPLIGVGQLSGQSPRLGNRLPMTGSGSGSSQPSSPLFLPAVTYAAGGFSPSSVAVADMNGDGKLDLVVANTSSNTVGILRGNGNGTFQAAVTYDVGGQIPVSVAVGNLLQGGDYRWSWRMAAPTTTLAPVRVKVAWACSLASSTPRR